MNNPSYPVYTQPHRRPYFPPDQAPARTARGWKLTKARQAKEELRQLGVSWWGFLHAELKELPLILHDDEHIKGVVYGRNEDGFALLVATDRRVLYLDKKLLFMRTDEVTYDLVGGVTSGHTGPLETIVLHTRLGDYRLRTMNFACAERFVHFIEQRCLEHKSGRDDYDRYPLQGWPV